MEFRRGYKQTEVGVIPEDWDVALISSLLALPIQNGVFNEPSRKGRGCKLINVIDLYGSFPIDTKDLERFEANRDEFLRFGVKRGDMFFTRSSLTPDGIAKCNVYRGDGNEEIVFDCHIIRVRPNSSRAEPFYLARYCNSRPARSYLVANAKTTTMTTIDQSVVAKLPVALPPLPEQRAIAEALSDVDGLLGGLDLLIAKKRDMKQAAMQQLLTGKKRLPTFHGKWEVKRIGHFLKVRHGKSQRGIAVPDGEFPILASGGEIGRTNTPLYNKPSVLIGRKGTIDSPQYAATPFWTVDTLFFTEVSADADAKFVFYKFTMIPWRSYNEASGVPSLNAKTIENIEIQFPSTKVEQTAIAEALTDMDAELVVLEQRREKTRAIKQAMMQELLTGKTRLK